MRTRQERKKKSEGGSVGEYNEDNVGGEQEQENDYDTLRNPTTEMGRGNEENL